MCFGCWEERGSPKIVNEKTIDAVPLIEAVYEANSVGGNLHIVLDDFNIDDCDLEACRRFIDNHEDDALTYCDVVAERACLDAFVSMTVDERASALAMYDGYFSADAIDKGEA
jgi:hypothetical protein